MFSSQIHNGERGRNFPHLRYRPFIPSGSKSSQPSGYLLRDLPCSLGFQGDSLDVTLGTDDIDDVHIPQFIADDAGSQGEWDPNQATSSRAMAAVPSSFTLSTPITDSLRTVTADTQVSLTLVHDSDFAQR